MMSPLTVVSGNFSSGSGLAVASKLEAFTRLSADDRAALREISRNFRYVDARRDLISEGDKPRHVHLVLDGWPCRYKQLPDGKRQIVALFVPGDFCDVNVYVLRYMDHSIGALTRLKVAMITAEEMNALTAWRPRITQALVVARARDRCSAARMDPQHRPAKRLRTPRSPSHRIIPAPQYGRPSS